MGLLYGNIILLLCVLIELGYIHFFRKESINFNEVTANINSGHILLFIFRSLGLAVYYYVWNNFSFGLMETWPDWLTWLFCIFAWDLCYYWSHRLHHHFSVLWFVHQVHHQGEHFNLSLGLRNSWYSTLTSLPFFLVLALLGIPLEIFITISAFHYFIQFLNHSHLIRKIPWLNMIFITPSDHRVHHGKNDPYRDTNFGGTFVIWDKIFRTFQPEMAETPVEYGIPNRVNTSNTLVINNSYFVGRFFTARQGSQPKQNYTTSIYLTVTGCLILFGLLLCYLYKEPTMPGVEKLLLFTIIFLGTIANGGLSDGSRWSLLLSFFNNIFLGSVYLILFRNIMFIQVILFVLFITHTVLLFFDYYLSQNKNSHPGKIPFSSPGIN